jgi:nucleotidyltransferase/DNA polymerase involved in DNA repair
MKSLGIDTIGELAKCDVQRLISVFGRTQAAYFHNASLGIDATEVLLLMDEAHNCGEVMQGILSMAVSESAIAQAERELASLRRHSNLHQRSGKS